MFGELKQRSVLWDEPRAAAERVGVNYFMGVVLSNSVNQIPCPKYRYLFTVSIDVRS